MPTRAPSFERATARFTATVVLPTPPLPAPTAITFFTPGSGGLPYSGADADRTENAMVTPTLLTPGTAATAARARSRTSSRAATEGLDNSMVTAARPSTIWTSFTNLSDTMSVRRSGSCTPRSAARTSSDVIRNLAYHAAKIDKLRASSRASPMVKEISDGRHVAR